MSFAAARLGWRCCRSNSTREIETFAPDVVLAEHFFVPKLLDCPTLGLMWNPPAFWTRRDEYIKNVISYDGHLFADRLTRQCVRDLVSPLATRFVEGEWLPTCQATALVEKERQGIAYFETGWNAGRHQGVLHEVARSAQVHLYGPKHRRLPFDGLSVLQALTRHAAALCLHSEQHRALGTPSARVFEAAAAGAVIISDQNSFVRETFGDAALYLAMDDSPERIAAQVLRHLSWIESNPEEARNLRHKANRIFNERLTFDSLLAKLPDLVADVKSAWCGGRGTDARSVAYIVRTGGRDVSYLDRALTSLERQTHANLTAIVVAYRNADTVNRYLAARATANLRVTAITSVDTGLRSTALWAGLGAVSSEFYGILDDDDTLLPNHVASCLATLDANPDIDLAYGGTILVHEDGRELEPRSVMSFPHFVAEVFRQRNDICSNAWLARRATLARAGPDPELTVGEDYYLLLRLYRDINCAPTWRLTAEYRQRSSDEMHSRLSMESDVSFERVKTRLYFAPHSVFAVPSAPDVWSILAKNDFVAGRILGQAIKRRYRRKGLQIYLMEVSRLPGRICRLPALLARGGIKTLVRRLENRGAEEYARRARMSSIQPDR
jgi:phosphoglycerol transferase